MNTSKMKTTLFTLVALIGFTAISIAQPGPKHEQKKEKVEAMKIGFITQQMDLTPEEAQKFWPVYNQMNNEIESLRKERQLSRENVKDNFETMTDPEFEKLINDEIASRQKEFDIQKKYVAQFKAVVPIKKVAQFYRAEEQFKRKLLEKIQEKKQE
jgi:Spy/CpxP family protein refolding chaperone